MPRHIIVQDAEDILAGRLDSIKSEQGGWRVAALAGSTMCLSYQRMLELRESWVIISDILSEYSSEIYVYLCRDGDIILLFRHSVQKSEELLQRMLAELQPHLAVGDIPFKALFGFYDLSVDYDLVCELAQEKLANRRKAISRLSTPQAEPYPWDEQKFLEVTAVRESREQKKVLLVEDDTTLRTLAATVLRAHYDVTLAADGRDALDQYNIIAPDLVFLDIEIPYIDGLSVLHTLMHYDAQAQVVMFSSHSEDDTLKQALIMGAQGFVTKPFTTQALLSYARQLLKT